MDFPAFKEMFKEVLDSIDENEVNTLTDLFFEARKQSSTVYVIGNGGSAANASHLCEDMAKGTVRNFDRQKRLKVCSLTDNTPGILAWGNDEGFHRIFVEQLRTFAQDGDILVALSGSGNSRNILEAVQWANNNRLKTIGITGYNGGQLKKMSQYTLHVPVDNMGVAEAAHDVVFHFFVETLCKRFSEEDGVM